jgi:hypothetical protein
MADPRWPPHLQDKEVLLCALELLHGHIAHIVRRLAAGREPIWIPDTPPTIVRDGRYQVPADAFIAAAYMQFQIDVHTLREPGRVRQCGICESLFMGQAAAITYLLVEAVQKHAEPARPLPPRKGAGRDGLAATSGGKAGDGNRSQAWSAR